MATHPKPLDKIHRAIQLAAFHYITCLKAKPSNADYRLVIDRSEFHFENIRTADSTELCGEFQSWAASAVLRDLIENFSIFLMEIYRDAVENAPERTFSTKLSQFERMGIEDQLTVLGKEFAVVPEWIVRLTGYNRARNCLAHRAGVIGLPDATDGTELVIRWLVTRIALSKGTPGQFVDVHGPMGMLVCGKHVHGNSAATIELLDREKRVSIGSLIQFLPDEVLELCQTLQLASAAFSGIKALS